MTGKLIVFEGGDGTGKSTQAGRFRDKLASRGLDPLHIREPGSTPLGEKVRAIILEKTEIDEITPESEMLLYMVCRAQLFKTVIAPAVAEGRIVILERSYLSTYAYQGAGLGLDGEMILQLGQWVSFGVKPDRVLLLDMETGKSLTRTGEEKDRIESRSAGFHERVRQGYLDLAKSHPDWIRVIDGSGRVEEVESRIHAELNDIC